MCGCGENTQKTETIQRVPDWMEQAGKDLYTRASGNSDYTPYGGPVPVSPLSDLEGKAFGMIEGMADAGNPYTSDIENMIRQYSTDLPRLIDNIPGGASATGGAGSIQDYMNPYLEGVLGPMLREISEKAELDRNRLGGEAIMAGAFGDTRHGIESALQRQDENQLRSDTTGKVMASAFDTAMGLRNNDINRLMERLRAGASDLMALDKHDTGRAAGLADSLARAGATTRGIEDRSRQFEFEEFLRKEGWDMNAAKQLASILTSAPYTKHNTSTTTVENNDIWKEIAGLGGALLGSFIPGVGPMMSMAGAAGGAMDASGNMMGGLATPAGWW